MDSVHKLRELIAQSFPAKPKFTDKDIPDLTGKVSHAHILFWMLSS
jgi:hypothetical protein